MDEKWGCKGIDVVCLWCLVSAELNENSDGRQERDSAIRACMPACGLKLFCEQY